MPWVGDIVEVRFTLVLSLCAAVMAAVAIDRVRAWASTRRPAGDVAAGDGAAAGVAVVVPSLPGLAALWPNLPLTVRPVVLPRWYQEVGATLPPGQVVLSYPAPFSGLQSPRPGRRSTGCGTPGRRRGARGPARPGRGRPGRLRGAVRRLLPPRGAAPRPTAANLAAVRRALADWRVTTVVVPDQPDLPLYEQGRARAYAVGLFTAALGEAPTYDHSAWVWSAVALGGPVGGGPGGRLHRLHHRGCRGRAVADRRSPRAC